MFLLWLLSRSSCKTRLLEHKPRERNLAFLDSFWFHESCRSLLFSTEAAVPCQKWVPETVGFLISKTSLQEACTSAPLYSDKDQLAAPAGDIRHG